MLRPHIPENEKAPAVAGASPSSGALDESLDEPLPGEPAAHNDCVVYRGRPIRDSHGRITGMDWELFR